MIKFLIAACLSILFISCSSSYIAQYVLTPQDTLLGQYKYSYSKDGLNLLLDINADEINMQLQNDGKDTIKILWDKCFVKVADKDYKLMHTNLWQEKIKLNDSTAENYKYYGGVSAAQLRESNYKTLPSVILPGMIYTDEIKNVNKGDFLPYHMVSKESLNNAAAKFDGKSLSLNLALRINSKEVNLPLTFKINSHYLLRQG